MHLCFSKIINPFLQCSVNGESFFKKLRPLGVSFSRQNRKILDFHRSLAITSNVIYAVQFKEHVGFQIGYSLSLKDISTMFEDKYQKILHFLAIAMHVGSRREVTHGPKVVAHGPQLQTSLAVFHNAIKSSGLINATYWGHICSQIVCNFRMLD